MNPHLKNARELPAEPTGGMTVKAAIARRVSCRAYLSQPVPEAHVMQILDEAYREPR